MNRESIDDRSRQAAEAARAWASNEADSRTDADLLSVRQAAGLPAVAPRPRRRARLILAAASVVAVAAIGLVVVVGRSPGGDVLVPAETEVVDSAVDDSTTTVATDPVPSSTPTATTIAVDVDVDGGGDRDGDGDVDVETNGSPSEREFVIDLTEMDVQNSSASAEAVLGRGPGNVELAGDGEEPPIPAAMIDDVKFVVADPANGRVQIIDWYGVEVSRQEFGGEEFGTGASGGDDGGLPGLFPSLSLPLVTGTGDDASTLAIGQPIVAPTGNEIFVPVRSPDEERVTLQRFVRGVDFPWEFADTSIAEIDGFDVDDELIIEQRSIIHVPTGDVVHDFGPDAPFVPTVRQNPGGWTVTDERGVDTNWNVDFPGEASGLVDGSVVIAGSRSDGDQGDLAVLLRLWPDGTAAMSRFVARTGVGVQRVTERGGSTITTTDDGDWLLQQWPLPAQAIEPPAQPDEQIGSCGLGDTPGSREQANGYVFPWTVSGGRAGDNGAYVVVYDALGRSVIGGGCSSASNPPDPLSISGASYTTYGDSVIVAVAEPLSTGGVNAPEWLGEPLTEAVIESLASEVKVFRVPDDRELPDADEDNAFLLVQLRGARLVRISSSGIGVYLPPEEAASPVSDPHDLQSTATEFTQGYLDALAEGRWEDAVTYIENDGRSWRDRPAFADLFALVGDEVGTAAALERWCTEERDCTRGVVSGVLSQVSETQVVMAITFEVQGGVLFEQTINPQWTVGWFEGELYVDGLPQVAR